MMNRLWKSCRPLPNIFKSIRRSLFIRTEDTPNEHSLKFKTGQPVTGTTAVVEFLDRNAARRGSDLADDLFCIEGVEGVMLGNDFITVTKSEHSEWSHLRPSIFAAIMDFISTGKPFVRKEELAGQNGDSAMGEEKEKYTAEEWEVVLMIKEILDTRVRPTVQDDGGDVQFVRYRDGIVELVLKGACRSCSSSVVTLKHGIENMLMHYIPEVKEVRQVDDSVERASKEYFERMEKEGEDR